MKILHPRWGSRFTNALSYRLKARRTIPRIQPSDKRRHICLILNPASGKDRPVLRIINQVFKEAGVDWELLITKEIGDGGRLAHEAVQAGFNIVAAYGGDGTIADVAGGLVGTDVPLGILPGGTTNAVATSLYIPRDLRAACALLVDSDSVIKRIDVGKINDHSFLQMVGVGTEAHLYEIADRTLKDRLGFLAYGVAAVQALHAPSMATYTIQIDEQSVTTDGYTCLLGLGGNVNFPLFGITNLKSGSIEVGLLRKPGLISIINLYSSISGIGSDEGSIMRWQGQKIRIDADPPQRIQADGEVLGMTPITCAIQPAAVGVLVLKDYGE